MPETTTTIESILERFEQAKSLDDWLAIRRSLNALEFPLPELNRVIEQHRGDKPATARIRGVAQWMAGKHSEAVESLETAKKGDGDGAVHYILGLCLRETGRLDDALKALEKARGKGVDMAVLAIAETYIERRQIPEAHDLLHDLGDSLEGLAEYWYVKGLVEDYNGRRHEALAAYEKTLSIEPEHTGALFRKAYHLDSRGDDEQALRIYERLRHTTPIHVNALINLGLIYEDREMYQRAVDCYKLVLKAYPSHPRARLYLKDAIASLDMYYDEDQERATDQLEQLLRTPVSEFELSVRSRNCLSRMKIDTLGDLVQKSEPELLSYKNFGETSLQEIKSILNKKGLRLGMKPGEQPAPVPVVEKPLQRDEMMRKPIAEINFSVRVRKVMERLEIHTLGDLVAHRESDLTKLKNFGKTSLSELKRKLAEYNVTLTPE